MQNGISSLFLSPHPPANVEDPDDPKLPDTGGDPEPDGPLAETGDKSGLWFLIGLTCVSATALLLALRMIKRRA